MSTESPCVAVCLIDPKTGVAVRRTASLRSPMCFGCGRTLPEIARWSWLDSVERRAIMSRLAQRMTEAGLTPPEA